MNPCRAERGHLESRPRGRHCADRIGACPINPAPPKRPDRCAHRRLREERVDVRYHVRTLPLSDEGTAIAKFGELGAEAARWKGRPVVETAAKGHRRVAWEDLEIRPVGRGVMVLVRNPAFSR
jgi:hypothetical protein